NYDPKGERFLIASHFPTPPLTCAFFSPGATVTYARYGHPVNGSYCQGCTLLQEKLKEDLVTYFQNFQNTSESSDDNTNVVNAPRNPFVVEQDHDVNPPHIDECCCKCGDALDGIFCQQCTCKSCGKAWDRVFKIKDALGTKQYKPEDIQELFHQLLNDVQNIHKELAEYINTPGWNRPAFYDDDDDNDVDYTIAITPVLSIKESIDSLKINSGNTTTHSDISLSDYEAFYFDDDHIEEISSGSTTTNSYVSLSECDSFIFDLANDQFPPTDRSDLTYEEFVDELAHIISPPEYDCFYF
nr:hypothetical protein [Tanacetum cinerariifolium]